MQLNVSKWILPLVLFCACFAMPALAAGGLDGTAIEVWMAIPFAGILLSIAVFPLVAEHWWHHNFGKVALFWGVVGAGLLFMNFEFSPVLYEVIHIVALDYVPFIILLLGLFTIAGGVRIKGKLRGSPKLNAIMLIIGTLLASWMGTTGAAMLMVRPLIKANEWRKRKTHIIVFFIFLVCNIGGSLTPLGDPPLFLGFLKGVSFTWTFNMFMPMMLLTIILTAVFYVFDTIMLKKEEHQEPPAVEGEEEEKFGMEGAFNFALLACLIGAILLGSTLATGAFVKTEEFDKYKAVIEHSGERANKLQEALSWVQANEEGKYGPKHDADAADLAKAAALYKEALDISENIHAEDNKLHDAHHASLESEDVELLASAAPGGEAEGDHGDDHAHENEDEKAFVVDAERAATLGRATDKTKDYAGGLAERYAKLAAGGVEAADISPLVLIDFQHAVMRTNYYRGHQSHDSTMGLHIFGVVVPYANLIRDLIILLLALISWKVTSRESRKKNGFTWFPIVEVAKLFAAIFICIIPALKILQAGVDGSLAGVVNMVTNETGMAINEMYFWLTGILSSFLDNAPTYLVFFNTAGGDAQFLMNHGEGGGFYTLLAISMGAVFMGANTYIGNAPNFMVKAIAEESDIKMPSFFGYMIWSVAFLVPLFVIVDIVVIKMKLFDAFLIF